MFYDMYSFIVGERKIVVKDGVVFERERQEEEVELWLFLCKGWFVQFLYVYRE